jgi:3-phytase
MKMRQPHRTLMTLQSGSILRTTVARYGLKVDQQHSNNVFVTERERGLVRRLEIEPTSAGTLTYRVVRTFLFDTSFDLKDSKGGRYTWTPCREAVEEEPQSEGLVFDAENDMLYVAFETISLYRMALKTSTPEFVTVGGGHLIEPVRSFGQAFHAIPDDDEFECEYDPQGPPAAGTLVAPGSNANVGAFIEADLEGLSIIRTSTSELILLASSQGDSSFHFPDGTPEEINGYEVDGATQFLFVNFEETLRALRN